MWKEKKCVQSKNLLRLISGGLTVIECLLLFFFLRSVYYGTEIEIYAGFGLVGNTEKNIGPIMYISLEGGFFMF